MGKISNFGDIKYKIFEGNDDIFDEKNNCFLAMRKVAWYNSNDKQEPTIDDAKLELRKWRVDESGIDIPNKGMTFITPNGPNVLAELLLKKGYGDTKKCLLELKKRDDFKDAVKHLYDDKDNNNDDEFFDIRNELLAE